MQKLILMALAGAAGTLSRFAVATLSQRWLGDAFPWGTLFVNLIGCFLFGLVLELWRERGILDQQSARLLLVGFIGAFTTFSSYVNDLVGLASTARFGATGLAFVLHNAGGIVSFLGGMALGRLA